MKKHSLIINAHVDIAEHQGLLLIFILMLILSFDFGFRFLGFPLSAFEV